MSRLLTRRYDEALRPAGLSANQFELMATVRAAEPVGQARLAALLETDQTTLSRNLKLLLARGWVEMASDDRDGRRRRYRLSGPGTVALRDAKACWDVVHREMEGLLGGSMEDLWPVLDRIQDAARDELQTG